MADWQPIETAPKDGSQFLIWTKRLGFAVVTHDVDNPMPTDIIPSGHSLCVHDGKFGPYPIRGDYPTQWMPLPGPPKAVNVADTSTPTLDPNKVQICRVAPLDYDNGQPCACSDGACSLWRGGMRPAPLSRNDAEKDAKDATDSGAEKP